MIHTESHARVRSRWLPPVAAAAVVLIFFLLNRTAWDGFFQDDELDNLSWATLLGWRDYLPALFSPLFNTSNFRPVGHSFFTIAGRAFGMDFPPYITVVLSTHLANCVLLFALLRRLGIEVWHALAGAAFFALSASAMDAYWNPMYIFDLLCATFSLASIVFLSHRQWILSFAAYWLAYKSKELAVMLPFVLLAYEYWFGRRQFAMLVPFFVVSLSFGVQGLVRNPNVNNDYTFRFTSHALLATTRFYSKRFLFFPGSGFLLALLLLVRDRRVWFGLASMCVLLSTLLFLPGRLFEAYVYLPLIGAVIALTAASARLRAPLVWALLAVWIVPNTLHLRREQRDKLAQDDAVFAYVDALQQWAVRHPDVTTLVFSDPPKGFHSWGIGGAWNIAHGKLGLPAVYADSKKGREALGTQTVALVHRDPRTNTIGVQIHSPR